MARPHAALTPRIVALSIVRASFSSSIRTTGCSDRVCSALSPPGRGRGYRSFPSRLARFGGATNKLFYVIQHACQTILSILSITLVPVKERVVRGFGKRTQNHGRPGVALRGPLPRSRRLGLRNSLRSDSPRPQTKVRDRAQPRPQAPCGGAMGWRATNAKSKEGGPH